MSDMGRFRFVPINLVLAVVFAGVAVVLAAPDTGTQLLGWFAAGAALGVLNWLWLVRRRQRATRIRGNARLVVIGIGVVVVAAARVFLGEGFVPVLMAFGSGVVLIGAFPPGAKTR
jgi:hypothetical protein